MTQDMTVGSPLRLIVMFTIPLLIGNVFQQLYNIADTVIVGRTIGVQALAAVGATGPLCFLVLGFFFGFTGGVTVITAQRFGAKDHRGVRRSIATATILCAGVSLVATVASVLLTRPLLRMMNTPEDIFDGASGYLSAIFIGIGATVFYNLISGIIRALGDSRTPLIFLIIASVLNIVLDFIFILWFDMGVAGAALGTLISRIVEFTIIVGYFFLRDQRIHYRIRNLFDRCGDMVGEYLRISIPVLISDTLLGLGNNSLAAVTLNAIGAPLTDWQKASLELRKEVPVLNGYGYKTSDGTWHSLSEDEGSLTGAIRDIEWLQYLEYASKL